MNTKLLLIAIAVLAAVGIATGLLIATAGQYGPLGGDIAGPRNTTMTIAWAFPQTSVGPALPYTVSGHLVGPSGAGVQNKIITIRCLSDDGQGIELKSNTTDSDGYWSVSQRDDRVDYIATFAGDSTFGSSSAHVRVEFPKQFPTLTLSSSKSHVTEGETYQLSGELRTNEGAPIADVWIDIGAYPVQIGYWTFTTWQVGHDGRFVKNETGRTSSTRHQAEFVGNQDYFGTESNIVNVTVGQ